MARRWNGKSGGEASDEEAVREPPSSAEQLSGIRSTLTRLETGRCMSIRTRGAKAQAGTFEIELRQRTQSE